MKFIDVTLFLDGDVPPHQNGTKVPFFPSRPEHATNAVDKYSRVELCTSVQADKSVADGWSQSIAWI
jgi:hypothetical protein